ncbi:hypothetical protein HELRODRAFT_182581 [Helobdella robusta]|uniref:Uncharacterized protein n=1 Tax=Helobdella robusta TaxID=6412 RepID=T1FIE4_HELRO|nr:hypothetical protein HELRODRAFT_182581 [Helobdella robusta]ESN90872.1 hypothetical protein HELRODRAFT_182581 [Helobdella robusta]
MDNNINNNNINNDDDVYDNNSYNNNNNLKSNNSTIRSNNNINSLYYDNMRETSSYDNIKMNEHSDINAGYRKIIANDINEHTYNIINKSNGVYALEKKIDD